MGDHNHIIDYIYENEICNFTELVKYYKDKNDDFSLKLILTNAAFYDALVRGMEEF